MLDVFVNVIMPVFLVAVLAAAFQRWRKAAVGPLSQVTLYLLTPALIFTSLVKQEIPPSATFRIVATLLVANAFIITTSLLVSFALRHDRSMRSAFVLSTGFPERRQHGAARAAAGLRRGGPGDRGDRVRHDGDNGAVAWGVHSRGEPA